ncbi:hypothetical protein D3C86_1484620 [compost metagenome]
MPRAFIRANVVSAGPLTNHESGSHNPSPDSITYRVGLNVLHRRDHRSAGIIGRGFHAAVCPAIRHCCSAYPLKLVSVDILSIDTVDGVSDNRAVPFHESSFLNLRWSYGFKQSFFALGVKDTELTFNPVHVRRFG